MELTLKRLLEQAKFTTYKGKGYESAEVDSFLDRAAAMAGKVEVQLTQAMDKAARAGESSGPDPAAVEAEIERRVAERMTQRGSGPGEEETAEEARRMLLLAQRTADAAIRDARSDAEKLVGDAQERSQAMVAEAEANARSIRADNESALARERNEARRQVAEEIVQLEATRDGLGSDIEVLEHHVKDQRDKLGASVTELQRFLDDATGLHPTPTPELNDPDIPDLTPSPVPPSSTVGAPASDAAKPSSGERSASSGPGRPEPTPGSQDPGPAPEGRQAPDPAPAPDQGRSADGSPPDPRGASAPVIGGSPQGRGSPSSARADVSTLTVEAPVPKADRPFAPPASSAGYPSLTFDDVDHEAPGLAQPGAEVGPPTAPVDTVDLREDKPAPASASSDDDAFLAELRKAMSDDEPLGPRVSGERGDHGDLFDDDRRSWRFGRRR